MAKDTLNSIGIARRAVNIINDRLDQVPKPERALLAAYVLAHLGNLQRQSYGGENASLGELRGINVDLTQAYKEGMGADVTPAIPNLGEIINYTISASQNAGSDMGLGAVAGVLGEIENLIRCQGTGVKVSETPTKEELLSHDKTREDGPKSETHAAVRPMGRTQSDPTSDYAGETGHSGQSHTADKKEFENAANKTHDRK